MRVAAEVLEELVEIVEARIGEHRGNARERVVLGVGIMLDVQAESDQQPLRHLDPEAVVAAHRLFAFVRNELDDVLNVLDFVVRSDADSVEWVQVDAGTISRRGLKLVDALAQAAVLRTRTRQPAVWTQSSPPVRSSAKTDPSHESNVINTEPVVLPAPVGMNARSWVELASRRYLIRPDWGSRHAPTYTPRSRPSKPVARTSGVSPMRGAVKVGVPVQTADTLDRHHDGDEYAKSVAKCDDHVGVNEYTMNLEPEARRMIELDRPGD